MEYYNIRVLPIVKFITVEKNGKKYQKEVPNLTMEEQDAMSIKPVMYWEFGDEAWLAERPLGVNISGSILDRLFYVYDDLTEEEKEKYRDRSINMHLTREKVTKVYKTYTPKQRKKVKND